MNGTQCDGCGNFSVETHGWFRVQVRPSRKEEAEKQQHHSPFVIFMMEGGRDYKTVAILCSKGCFANYQLDKMFEEAK